MTTRPLSALTMLLSRHTRRRDFITLLGGAAASWPLATRAQQAAIPVIGFLRDTSLADATYLVAAFRQGLKEAGFIEGQNVAIEYRSAEDQPHRLPALVADSVRRQVALIVCNTRSAFAAKAATTTVPIVCDRGRPGQGWSRRQPQPAGRQRDRIVQSGRRSREETP